jgi:hypothetical protein
MLFLVLKRDDPRRLGTGVLRTVGAIDPLFINLSFDGHVIFSRATSTLVWGIGQHVPETILTPELDHPPSAEHSALLRAVDLVNHGYYWEGLVAAHALLDTAAQSFLEERLPNLSKREAGELLRGIESRRLHTYLGILTKLVSGRALIDDRELRASLKHLNEKRNAAIHEGEYCSRADAQKGITTVLRLLKALNDLGANFDLPDDLPFWTA